MIHDFDNLFSPIWEKKDKKLAVYPAFVTLNGAKEDWFLSFPMQIYSSDPGK
jgi:hypothetical protein